MRTRFIQALLMPVYIAASISTASAQKFAYVDSHYILSKIPEYKAAQDQLDQISISWHKEIEAKQSEVDQLYKAYKADEVLLTDEMKQKRQGEIEQKEQAIKDLQKQHFGVNGDLFKKRQELVKPVQDKVFNAVQELAQKDNLAIIFDQFSNDVSMLYANPKYDKSDEILKNMGITPGNKDNKENKENKENKDNTPKKSKFYHN